MRNNYETNAMENGAFKVSKVRGNLSEYDYLQNEWDYALFNERVDLWYEGLNEDTEECIICWAVWDIEDDATMWELLYTNED